MKVQAELDETKIILHKTIESVLERGEKLDNLVERSDALSAQSRMFYKTAKKQVLSFWQQQANGRIHAVPSCNWRGLAGFAWQMVVIVWVFIIVCCTCVFLVFDRSPILDRTFMQLKYLVISNLAAEFLQVNGQH